MAYPIARRSLFPFVSIFAKNVEGVDRVPMNDPVIIAANHLGLFDPLFLGVLFIRKTKKKLRFLVDTRNLFWKTMGIGLQHWTNNIPVRPGKHEQVIDDSVRALQRGDSIGLFPEGKVNTSPTLLSGRTGAVRMSLMSGKPILPVGIENTNISLITVLLRRFIKRQEGITIRFGVPYLPQGDVADIAVVRELTDDLMRRIAALSQKTYNP